MFSLRPIFWPLLGVALLTAGCGPSAPSFDAATAYSPGSLAQELVFQYKGLDPARRNAPRPRPARQPDAAATKEKKAAAKEAQAATLDDLVRDVKEKASAVPGMTPAEAVRRVADEVDKEASLAEADRKTIVERLRASGE